MPADQPDLVPAAEAGRLADLQRVLIDSDYARRRPAQFIEMMREANHRATELEDLLLGGPGEPAALAAQLDMVGASCKDCHRKYRN